VCGKVGRSGKRRVYVVFGERARQLTDVTRDQIRLQILVSRQPKNPSYYEELESLTRTTPKSSSYCEEAVGWVTPWTITIKSMNIENVKRGRKAKITKKLDEQRASELMGAIQSDVMNVYLVNNAIPVPRFPMLRCMFLNPRTSWILGMCEMAFKVRIVTIR
jgi:hypothetical protein